jgi:UDP-N-acetylglucosamine--N-acetylmuramyl-(pentapeptide) pyrophosphoryl-undecaprenol N-acetylglucosamine transferase
MWSRHTRRRNNLKNWKPMARVIISGGGTGGHVFPAIAIADAIRAEVPQADILFVGANGKMEMERVPKAGYRIEGLDISGFQRKLSLKNLAFPFKLAGSMVKATWIVKKFRPEVAVGVGGYASGFAGAKQLGRCDKQDTCSKGFAGMCGL